METITIFWTDERENHRQAKQFTDRNEADKFIEELKQNEHCFNIKEWMREENRNERDGI